MQCHKSQASEVEAPCEVVAKLCLLLMVGYVKPDFSLLIKVQSSSACLHFTAVRKQTLVQQQFFLCVNVLVRISLAWIQH